MEAFGHRLAAQVDSPPIDASFWRSPRPVQQVSTFEQGRGLFGLKGQSLLWNHLSAKCPFTLEPCVCIEVA